MAVTDLDATKGKKFLELLAEESFVCVVDTGDELRIFSKGIDPEQLARIQSKLEEAQGD